MFIGDFGHIKTAVKYKLFKQYSCSYYGAESCGDWHLFIHQALNHNSSVISNVAKLSIKNPWSNCGGSYCHIGLRCEYNMHEGMYSSNIGRVWQAGVSDERIYDVSVLSDMIETINCLNTCDMFSHDDVNEVITEITVF